MADISLPAVEGSLLGRGGAGFSPVQTWDGAMSKHLVLRVLEVPCGPEVLAVSTSVLGDIPSDALTDLHT